MTQPLWNPTAEQVANANLTRFRDFVREAYPQSGVTHDPTDYASPWRWSVNQREEFWPAVWDFCGIVAGRRWDQVLVDGDRMPGARWFVGAKLNFAENLLRERDARPAIVGWNERGRRGETSFADLFRETARLAAAMRRLGVERGDRVAAFVPNIAEAVVAMLAAASIGAVFSSCSPDFGTAGVLDRFGQIEPKLLVTVDGYSYGGKPFELLPRVREIAERMPSLAATLVVPYYEEATGERCETPLASVPGAINYYDALVESAIAGGAFPQLPFEQVPFDHPLYVLFSSGTTGIPKCIVHSVGGTLLQHQKEHVLHVDLSPEDRLFYFTTCGWMMWNWLTTALATQASIVLYDGSPFHPSPSALFDMAAAEQVTVFGTSAKYIASIEKMGLQPRETHQLPSLRTILSTGSPLLAESFDYVYRDVQPKVHLASISGGTDLVSCFALGNPTLPVWRGEMQCRGLGMDVAVVDDAGRPITQEKGELICRAAFPSMPIGFWNDPDGAKYRAAYFERFPNAWHHGDYAELTEHGGMIIYGRSDAVLNPGGVRIGTAEIYRQVEQLPEVVESIVVGQQWEGDVRVVLFVRLRDGLTLDEPLIARIKTQIRTGATPRHIPAVVLQVADIPRTKSGKIVELAVRNVIHQQPVLNQHALANPEALEHFRNRPELQS